MKCGERTARAWRLAPIPLIIPGDDWETIEKGLIQRARLLDRILADLYGPRELIQKGCCRFRTRLSRLLSGLHPGPGRGFDRARGGGEAEIHGGPVARRYHPPAAGRLFLRAAIRTHPHLYVGQEAIAFSTGPALVEGRIAPRHAVLRCFLATPETGYFIMPGGLTRAAGTRDSRSVANRG